MKFSSSFLALSFVALTYASPIYDQSLKGYAPLLSSTTASDLEVPNGYIVVFKDHVRNNDLDHHTSWVATQHHKSLKKRSQIPLFKDGKVDEELETLTGLKHTFNLGGLLGYAGNFGEDVVESIRKHPDVAYVEKDSIVHTFDKSATQHSAPWGLARISHRESLGFSTYNKYIHQANGGEGVDVYVIDTGTNVNHVDFEGRARWGKTIPQGDADEDGNGHGTHCSGTVGGKKYGVSKKANIIAVKVLRSNGSGTMSDVVKGVEYAALQHLKRAEEKDPKFKGSAANMSLGGGKSPTLDRAVNAAVQAGLHFAVAAGNDNADSCNYSPAAAEKAITVGASTFDDSRAYFSNYGKCVDIFAPGLNIQSTWIGSDHAINTISGTSMASPHVAGLLAYFLSLAPDSDSEFASDKLTPEKLKKNIIAIASKDVLSQIPSDTVNLLAWNGGGKSNLSEIFSSSYQGETPSEDKPKNRFGKIADRIKEIVEEVTEETESLFDELEKEVVGAINAARKHASA